MQYDPKTLVTIKVSVKAKNDDTGQFSERGLKLNVLGSEKEASQFVEEMQSKINFFNEQRKPQLPLKKQEHEN